MSYLPGLTVLLSGSPIAPQTFLFRNNCSISNSPPSAPTNLTFTRSNNTVTLSWNKSSDLQTTNANGLNYQVRIGTTPGGIDIKSTPANPMTGYRRVVQPGDTFTNAWKTSALSPGTYYWAVQAIDSGFAGSPFSVNLPSLFCRPLRQFPIPFYSG